jgi:centromere/kinetochore protein ZW10
MYLAEQLKDFVKAWSSRDDLGPRAQGKVRLDSEIEALEKFSRRAYGNEMSTQRTIITDLLGGAQNFLQQGDANDNQLAISSVVAHIRQLSKEWKKILSKSAWAQAIGSLLSALAKKIIIDVEDLTSLGADEAYRVASLISMIIRLDDLFLPSDASAPQIPLTSQYAPNWLKLNFLSEVLQSDLKDLKYLWFESDLSVYFSAQEVVELIELSFESNPRTREAIVRIREEPFPRGVVAERMV